MFFVWILPLLWGAGSLAQHRFPGDENAFYIVSSIPGMWVLLFALAGGGSVQRMAICVVISGAPIMAGIGLAMDRFCIRKSLWAVLWFAGAAVVFYWTLHSGSGVERGINRNGSWWAYIFLSANVGLYLSMILSPVLTCTVRAATWLVTVSKNTWW